MFVYFNCSGCHGHAALEVDALFDAVDARCNSCGHERDSMPFADGFIIHVDNQRKGGAR